MAAAQNEGLTVPVTFMPMSPVPGPLSDIQNTHSTHLPSETPNLPFLEVIFPN